MRHTPLELAMSPRAVRKYMRLDAAAAIRAARAGHELASRMDATSAAHYASLLVAVLAARAVEGSNPGLSPSTIDVQHETAYGSTQRLSFVIRCF